MRILQARDESGVTLVELIFVIGILSVVMVMTATVMKVAQRTESVGRTESASLDVARATSDQIQRDLRNALAVASCSPTGYCLHALAQLPGGSVDQIAYRAVAGAPGETELYRDSGCNAVYASCTVQRSLIPNLVNLAQSKPVFTCVSTTTLPRVDIQLIVTPLSASKSGTLTVQSSARPRNVTTAFC